MAETDNMESMILEAAIDAAGAMDDTDLREPDKPYGAEDGAPVLTVDALLGANRRAGAEIPEGEINRRALSESEMPASSREDQERSVSDDMETDENVISKSRKAVRGTIPAEDDFDIEISDDDDFDI